MIHVLVQINGILLASSSTPPYRQLCLAVDGDGVYLVPAKSCNLCHGQIEIRSCLLTLWLHFALHSGNIFFCDCGTLLANRTLFRTSGDHIICGDGDPLQYRDPASGTAGVSAWK